LYLQLKSQRYCLKFLSSERGKNFSCSTTSKNTVQYIAIQNLLFLRFRQKNETVLFFGKWCKGKTFFIHIQIFFEYFFSTSFRTLLLRKTVSFRSGCKDKDFILSIPNFSNSFFAHFYGSSKHIPKKQSVMI